MLDSDRALGSLLATAPPNLSEAEASDLAKRYFGIDAYATPLTSERDANFRLTNDKKRSYVLKITNAAEPKDLTNLQTSALIHIQKVGPELPIPRVLPALDGAYEVPLKFGSTVNTVRLLTYLEGQPLYKVESTSGLRENVGRCLARLSLALKDFDHPAGNHDLLWDIKNASRLRPLTDFVPDPARRALVINFLDRFEIDIAPRFRELRTQIVHNDFNPHNVLISERDKMTISGVIDFGDIVLTPLVNDLAVAASYHVGATGHPLAGIVDIVRAYHEVLPVQPCELDLLFDLITARLMTTVVITHWRAHQYPSNRAYILRNNARAWTGIERFAELKAAEARRRLADACNLE